MVEFGMTVQEACEAPNINSFQMRNSFAKHDTRPGALSSLGRNTRLDTPRPAQNGLQTQFRAP
jgi:hypothetical protein